MTSRLRMGVIGCGAIAQIMHIPYMVDYDEYFELIALADTDRATLDSVADHYNIAHRYTDWRDLLARDDIDAVGIFHSGSHTETVLAALEAGKHIFVEKPLAWNVREAEQIAARAATSDRIVQLGYHKLYDPGFAVAKDQLERMSDLTWARITVLHPANELGLSPYRIRRGNGVVQEGHVDTGTWESQVQRQLGAFASGAMAALVDEALGGRKGENHLRLGYGILCSSIIHQIYCLFGFLGDPSRVISTEIWREGTAIHAVIEYPNDVRCTLDWQFLQHLKDYREEYAFFGSRERVIMQLPSPYFKNFPSPVIVQGGEGELAWEKRIIVGYEEAFKNELLAFYQNVSERRQPVLSSVTDALKHTRLIQHIINAAR